MILGQFRAWIPDSHLVSILFLSGMTKNELRVFDKILVKNIRNLLKGYGNWEREIQT